MTTSGGTPCSASTSFTAPAITSRVVWVLVERWM